MIPTPERELLRSSLAALAPRLDELACCFYTRLFEQEPTLRALFPADLTEQRKKLLAMIGYVVGHLEEPAELRENVRALGRRHVAYGTQPDHYALVGSALIHALRETAGAAFTPEIEEAWLGLYGWLSEEMEAAAAEA